MILLRTVRTNLIYHMNVILKVTRVCFMQLEKNNYTFPELSSLYNSVSTVINWCFSPQCIYGFCLVLKINCICFPKHH